MRALNRKLLRDLRRLRFQVLAMALVVACGVATFVMSLGTLESLRAAQAAHYDRSRFAHVFARVLRAPERVAREVAEYPRVAAVETRVVADVRLEVPGMEEFVVGRLVSLPDRGEPAVNALAVRAGRLPEPGRRGEAAVSEAFAAAHGLGPGDRVRAVVNGRYEELVLTGVVLSPEYVFQVRAGDLLPDERRFGVLWLRRAELAAAFDLSGAFNDLVVRLRPSASAEEVVHRLDRLLAPYGGAGAHSRDEQTSHRYVSDEIRQLRGMAFTAPVIFLGVAAFLVHVVLTRLVANEREQIATLRAFGYTRREISVHYLAFTLCVFAIGAALGTCAGAWLGSDLTRQYTRYYRFPELEYRMPPAVVLAALLVALGAALAGALGAVRRATALPPAEGTRPESPASFRPTLLERAGIAAVVSLPVRMALRRLERFPLRSALACLGIALSSAVVVLGRFSGDALDAILATQFEVAERQDVTVLLRETSAPRVRHDLAHLPGVLRVEPFRAAPVRLSSGHRARRVAILGLTPGARLRRPVDDQGRAAPLPSAGLLVSAKLAEVLRARPGDRLTVEFLEGRREVVRVPLAAVVDDLAGTQAYMAADELHRLLHEGPRVSGAFLAVDSARIGELRGALRATPGAASVAERRAALETFRESVARNLLRMELFNMAFAGIIAFGVVYNTVRIALAERARELSTLRVLGFSRSETAAILLVELALLTAAALPLGGALGAAFAYAVAQAFETETYRIPWVVAPSTFGAAAVVTIAAASASAAVVARSLRRLDLVAVLRAGE